eukprot:TRINITY_DN13166_c0_g1_i5.p1 TRINITY_DN13166_c0_g1~~TRINITY_DN13166_c0_g1_i5.p1  ORF type:complete len:119 (+),score=37.22 TRINITY_DN13166_c0_g1_i5:140-496(+)
MCIRDSPKTGEWVGPNNDSVTVDESKPIQAGMKDKISGEADFDANICQMAPGHIGKMRVHKSGKVTMLIGDVVYRVNTGIKCAFAQQVLSVDVENQTCHFLGSLNDRLVCSLDVESLF